MIESSAPANFMIGNHRLFECQCVWKQNGKDVTDVWPCDLHRELMAERTSDSDTVVHGPECPPPFMYWADA
jgi:hypothetical protein